MRRQLPKLRHHKHTNRAVVTIEGRDVYLGKWGTPDAEREYRRVIAEFLATGEVRRASKRPCDLTIGQLVGRYERFCLQTMEARSFRGSIEPALRRLDEVYGHVPARDFDPCSLRTLQQAMLREKSRGERTLSRRYVNRLVCRVKKLFKWGVAEGLVEAGVWHALMAVDGVRMHAPGARETVRVRAVSDQTVEATLGNLPAVVADMVRVQRLTGMRPGEVCGMSAAEIDMSGEVWVYAPAAHKTAHRGQDRQIPIGPKAQSIIRPYLARRPVGDPLFTPLEHARRGGSRPVRTGYDSTTYARAIRRACESIGIDVWTPNQLRHARATEIRRTLGLEAAGAILGHQRVETTQIYAERNRETALSVALSTG